MLASHPAMARAREVTDGAGAPLEEVPVSGLPVALSASVIGSL